MPTRTRVLVLQGSVLLLVLAIVLVLRWNNHQLYKFKDVSSTARREAIKTKGKLFHSISVNLTKEIPAVMLERRLRADVKEYYAKVKNLRIFYREAIPVSLAKDRLHPRRHHSYQLLLLHGKSFTSQTWEDIGTLSVLAGLGHRVVALDLPGFGKSEKDASKEMNSSGFLMEVIDKLDLRSSLVIVSPSMSGTYSLPFLVDHPERVKGYVPVAPVGTEKYVERFSKVFVPSLIVVGSKDTRIGSVAAKHLTQLPNSILLNIPGAGHAAYIDHTHVWHNALYNFLNTL